MGLLLVVRVFVLVLRTSVFFTMRALFCLVGLFGGVDTLLGFALEDFGQKFPTVQEQVIVHLVEDVTILGVTASGIEVGEKGLEFFVKQGFGVIAGSNGVHRTSLSEGLYHHYNIPPPKFYAPHPKF
jgi:hypothetical protein